MSFVAKLSFNLRHHWRQKHWVRSLLADVLARGGASRFVTFHHAGCRLRLRRGGLARLLWSDPTLRLDGEDFFARFLRAGETVVDVGANIGVHSFLAARTVGETGRVLAIEAHPATYAALQENIRLNHWSNLTACHAAAGPEAGVVRFSDRLDDDWNHVAAGGSLEIQQATLDHLCRDLSRIDLLKIDVEGYELACLRGAAATLARTSCVLLEYWDEHARRFGYQWEDLNRVLSDSGFSGGILNERERVPVIDPLPSGRLPGELQNLVFARDLAVVRRRLANGQRLGGPQ